MILIICGVCPNYGNNCIIMFTGYMVGTQVLQAVIMPPLLLAHVAHGVKVENLAQQFLCFRGDNALAFLPPVVADIPEGTYVIVPSR
jgi:hypothetical protein